MCGGGIANTNDKQTASWNKILGIFTLLAFRPGLPWGSLTKEQLKGAWHQRCGDTCCPLPVAFDKHASRQYQLEPNVSQIKLSQTSARTR